MSGRTTQNKIVIVDGDEEQLTGEILKVEIEDSTGFTLFGNLLPELQPVAAGISG